MWGYETPAEMMERVVDIEKQHYVNPKGCDLFKAIMEEQGSVESLKVEIYRKDGSRIWVSLNARAVRDEQGKLLYYDGTNEDITEKKLMVDMIRENERRYRYLIENSNDIIYTTDLKGNITYLNPVTERVTGYAISQLLGKQFYKLIREDSVEAHRKFYGKQLLEELSTTYYEFPIVTRDGTEKWFGQQVQIILEMDNAVGFQATARDITDRLKAEEAVRQHEKLGAVVEMAGGICHEMNQPLQIISGLTDLMMMRMPADNPLQPRFGAIKQAVDRLAAITKRLMGITQYETKPYAGETKIVDIDRSSH
jgi:PAS domain S-box-containing protein